jgi:hypothetical protein
MIVTRLSKHQFHPCFMTASALRIGEPFVTEHDLGLLAALVEFDCDNRVHGAFFHFQVYTSLAGRSMAR